MSVNKRHYEKDGKRGEISMMLSRLSLEKAERLIKSSIILIERIIKGKIKSYDPLDFEMAFEGFIEWIEKNEFKIIRDFSGDCAFEEYLEGLVRNFLIEKAYFYLLFEDHELVERFIVDVCKKNKIYLPSYSEATIFVRAALENKKKLEIIKKKFEEKGKLMTYFYAMIRNAVIGYRQKYGFQQKIEADPKDLDKLKAPTISTQMKWESIEAKERVEELTDIEKIVFKFFYYYRVKIKSIAIDLKTSPYKVRKILKRAEKKVFEGK